MGVEATELTYLVKSGTTSLPKVSVPVVVVDVKRGEGNVVVTVQGVAGVPVKQILEGNITFEPIGSQDQQIRINVT